VSREGSEKNHVLFLCFLIATGYKTTCCMTSSHKGRSPASVHLREGMIENFILEAMNPRQSSSDCHWEKCCTMWHQSGA